MKKTPLQNVKERFGSKEALIEAVRGFTGEDLWVSRLNSEKGLEYVSNAKLLRLHGIFSVVKEKFGDRGALIDAILEALNRTKDTGYGDRLRKYPVPRLFDIWKSVTRRNAKAEKAEKAKADKAKAENAGAETVAAG